MIINKADRQIIKEIIEWHTGSFDDEIVEDIVFYLQGQGWDKNETNNSYTY